MEKILRIVTLTTALMFCSFFIYGQQLKTCTMENYVINSGEGPMSGKMTYTYYVDENGDRVRHGKMNITCQDTYEAIKPGYQTLKYKFSVKYEAAGTYKNGWLDGALTVKLTYTNVEDKPGTIVKTLVANYRNGVPHGSWNMTYVIRGETYDYVKINFNEGQLSGPFSYKIHNIFAWAGRNYDAQIVKGQLTNDGFLSGEWVVQTVQSTEKSFNFTPTGFYLKDLSEEDKECLKKFNYVITPEIMQKEHLIIEKKSINYLDHWGFLLDFIYQDHLFNLEIIGGDKTFGSNYKKQYMDRTWDDRVVKVKEQDMKEMSMETGYKSLIRFESKEVTDDQLAMIIRAQQVLDNTSTVDGRWAKNAIGCQNVIRLLNALILSEDEQFQYFKERELKKKNYTYKLTVEQKDYVQSQIPIWEEQLQKAKEAEKKEIAMKAQRERISLAEKWLDMYVYNRDDKLTISEPSLEVWLSSKTDREPVSPDNKMVFNSFSLNGEKVQNTNILKSVLTKKVLPFFPFKEYKIDSVSNIADTTWITCTISQRNMEPSGSSMHEKGDPKVWKTMVVVRGNMIDLDNSLDFSKVIKVRTKADDVEELISVTDSVHNVITGLDFPLLVNAYNNETTDLKNSMKRWGITTDEKLTKLQKLSKIQDAYLFFAKIEKQIDDYDKELMQETSSEFSDVAEWYSYLKKNYKTTSYSSDNIEDFKKSTDEYIRAQNYFVNLIKYRKAISALDDTIMTDSEQFPDIAKSYKAIYKARDLKVNNDLKNSSERIISFYETQHFYYNFIQLRKTSEEKETKITQKKQYADVLKTYSNFMKQYNVAISQDTADSYNRLRSLINIQDTCLKFLSLRDEIDKNNKELLNDKTCKNITKAYATYMKSADLAWNPDLNCCNKLRNVINIQKQFLTAVSTSKAAELDEKIKKLKDKSVENVLKELK